MTTQRYRVPIIGDGQSLATAYRPKVADLQVEWVTVEGDIPVDDAGRPLATHVVVDVTAADHAALLADPEIEAL